jgi:hypothetical protein
LLIVKPHETYIDSDKKFFWQYRDINLRQDRMKKASWLVSHNQTNECASLFDDEDET